MAEPKPREVLLNPLFNNNPIALQVLGICSALAVTTKMDTALVMCAAVIFVLAAVFATVIVIPLGTRGVGRIVGAIVAATAIVETVVSVVGLLTAVVIGGLNMIGPFGEGAETGTGGKDREAVLDAGAGPV